MSATASVVVASKTEEPLSRAEKLGVVPYGDGLLTLRRQSTALASAKIVEHDFGGQSRATHVEVRGGVLEISLREIGSRGSPIEWIEIEILSPINLKLGIP